MKTLLKYLALASAIAGLTQVAHAVPQLRLFDGTNTMTITDNGAGDVLSGTNGAVLFAGSFGNWTLNVHTGTTYPILGSLTNPVLDLSFVATSSSNVAETLWVSFSADGFGPTNGSTIASIGGTVDNGNTVSYNTYGGNSNTHFDTTNLLTSQGPFGGPSFSGTVTGGSVNNVGPYSLTQVVAITHAAGTFQTTGDAKLSVPESGTSILLLGAGLTGLGLIARFRRRVA